MKHVIDTTKIPHYVTRVTDTLEKAGFEAFIVGGCVRDLIIEREPKDWDVTTNATPEQIIPLFERTVYENKFGTVGIVFEDVTHETGSRLSAKAISTSHLSQNDVSRETVPKKPIFSKALADETNSEVTRVTEPIKYVVEVTPYREEAQYSDNRHPDEVKFSKTIEEDLKRRDFTCNAMAYSISHETLIDLYKGQQDIKDKVLRTVGDADERFNEDALRMLRAVRFAVNLGFTISTETTEAILKNSDLIKKISTERIRDEFEKIILSPEPAVGVGMLQKFGLLKHFIPELEEGIGCEQLGEHIYDVYEHLLHALQQAATKKWSLEVRLAALFHDVGKPRTRRYDATKAGGKGKYTFYGHEVVGARMAQKIMERMKFPKKSTDLVVKLVRQHMFFSDTETITLSAVRRVVAKVGKENIWTLMNIRECDRVGMKKKEAPYRLRKYHAMIEEVLRDPISVGQLAIDGNILMTELSIKPGPRMGWLLHALLEEVLDDPKKNSREYLDKRVGELEKLSDKELKALGEEAKKTKEELEEKEVAELHMKHGVKK
ncbi:MAG: CCA tRNA nucleotidyltransferase [Candidatus Pacebacteria bacterium]|nr:CCA tRNA nucleotidyltransferase [Candidatus Paceibacterota bacterium]